MYSSPYSSIKILSSRTVVKKYSKKRNGKYKIDIIDLSNIVHPNTATTVPEYIGCRTTRYTPDVIKFDFFLTLGIVPNFKRAKMMGIHPNTKSNIPIGSEIKSLTLNLFCGISGEINNGPTTTKTLNFWRKTGNLRKCFFEFLFDRNIKSNKKPHKLIDNTAIGK